MGLLEAVELTKRFKGILALDKVSFNISAGEIVGIIGPNGAGKTTLLNVLNGYIKPDGGVIRFKGLRVDGRQPFEMARLGMARTYQVAKIFRRMNVLENVLVPLYAVGTNSGANVEKAHRILEQVGLSEKAYSAAGSLSGGQKKLLEFARALAFDPDLMLLDEPFAGVHPMLVDKMISIIREKNSGNKMSCVIVSHDIPTTVKVCSRLLAMHEGKVVAEGSPEEVTKDIKVIESYLGI